MLAGKLGLLSSSTKLKSVCLSPEISDLTLLVPKHMQEEAILETKKSLDIDCNAATRLIFIDLGVCKVVKRKENNIENSLILLFDIPTFGQSLQDVLSWYFNCSGKGNRNCSSVLSTHIILFHNESHWPLNLGSTTFSFISGQGMIVVCHIESGECREIFKMFTKEIFSQNILIPSTLKTLTEKISFLVTGITSRRQNFASGTFPGVAMNLPGLASEKFKPRPTPDSPLEFKGGANVVVYRFLRDALNFSEKAIGSTQSFVQDANGLLQNEGTVKIINQNEAGIADV
ncbi:hypothetical protein Ocin01_09340 [Orchesella cincta]|uniref:Uncharacterized protein n=1 Tax=Orchesella cincta TaxID=48709 RepID=A0A1D2MXC4_ORCCI|nr:hypothetical protein Ocin01_09340 [Orchesella cincta]